MTENARVALVVDDSRSVRQQVGLALEQAGFKVKEAEDGRDGVHKLNADDSISLLVLDVNMPVMNGMEMLAQVKADGKNKDLPVIMLTTEGSPDMIKEARNAGAAGWVLKPFKADKLVAAAEKLVPRA